MLRYLPFNLWIRIPLLRTKSLQPSLLYLARSKRSLRKVINFSTATLKLTIINLFWNSTNALKNTQLRKNKLRTNVKHTHLLWNFLAFLIEFSMGVARLLRDKNCFCFSFYCLLFNAIVSCFIVWKCCPDGPGSFLFCCKSYAKSYDYNLIMKIREILSPHQRV